MIYTKIKNSINREFLKLGQNQIKCFSGFIERKRFYKCVTITTNDNKYEINLDGRKLKTPNGNVFFTYNQWLAIMVSNEWQSQKDVIRMDSMHLTHLTNTSIDNPINTDGQTLARNILNFIDTDTLCFRVSEPKELLDLQTNKWNPIIDWFESRFDCKIPVTQSVHLNTICESTKNIIYRHLCSHNRWSLVGLMFATENLKSLILSLALTQRLITVNQSVDLTRLEEDFEILKWGRIGSTHDLELHELRARVSAALLFYFCNCEVRELSQKGYSLTRTLKSVI